jgi:hypothetical protein
MNIKTSLVSLIITSCIVCAVIISYIIAIVLKKYLNKLDYSEEHTNSSFNPLNALRPIYIPESRTHIRLNSEAGDHLEMSEDPLPLYEPRASSANSNITIPISQNDQIEIQIHQLDQVDEPPAYI